MTGRVAAAAAGGRRRRRRRHYTLLTHAALDPHPCFSSRTLQGSYALFWLIYYCTLAVGIVLAYAVAALSPNMDVANAALPTLVVTFLFFAGFLLRWTDIPPWCAGGLEFNFIHL